MMTRTTALVCSVNYFLKIGPQKLLSMRKKLAGNKQKAKVGEAVSIETIELLVNVTK